PSVLPLVVEPPVVTLVKPPCSVAVGMGISVGSGSEVSVSGGIVGKAIVGSGVSVGTDDASKLPMIGKPPRAATKMQAINTSAPMITPTSTAGLHPLRFCATGGG